LIEVRTFLAALNQVGMELEIPWRHRIRSDLSWKFLGGTESDLIGVGNFLAKFNQV
jgi:hypothetical protein